MPELPDGYKGLLMGLLVPGLYCLMVVVGRRLKRKHGVRLGVVYHLFALSLAVCLPAILLGVQWVFLRPLCGVVVVLGSLVVISLVDRYLWELYLFDVHRVVVPKFLRELVRIGILVLAIFLVLEVGYGQTIKGLLIAPGIAAVIIGLAMQDLLGNIIAGLSLQAGKSFAQGDWLLIDNRHAEVLEINWRATRLRTVDDISIEIPNREIARQTIINLNRPQRRFAMRIAVTLDYAAPPTRAKNVLLHAVANARGVAPEPKPRVFLKNFGDSGVEYEIQFWLENHDMFYEVSDAIRTNVWYGLRRHGIRIPYPTQTVQIERPARDKQQEVQSAARIILRQQALFKCLSDEQLDALLPRGKVLHFGRGEKLIEQGEDGESMFILVEGAANVVVDRHGASRHIASLKSGDCFGEMSLLTGERRSATVVAESDCEVVEIGKPVLARGLREHPNLLSQLSELLARRQMETKDVLAAHMPPQEADVQQTQYAAGFVAKLRAFFEL
ncbi:MAG TPA: mechanosensitive ion channel family protein [Candidatus Binatia bacterium]|jgi:small-conductance mechanosensitive channel/CRP-like cAMP-binding protein|nr:mechanosensitive ion channel family protein [Candidatus Binatia bacterium]